MKQPARIPSDLPESLRRSLNSYAVVASAAGVSLLALAQAEAKIIYTPANRECPCTLDINHDGMKDFGISGWNGRIPWVISSSLSISPLNRKNQIWGYNGAASALASGVRLGSNPKFALNHDFMAEWFQAGTSNTTNSGVKGPWANVRNRYLGLKFISVKGQIHYGWARLSVSAKVGSIIATLSGYAYETIPSKPIIAGKTHGGNEATLGRLAEGVSGMVSREKK